jgi:hypothetical protein
MDHFGRPETDPIGRSLTARTPKPPVPAPAHCPTCGGRGWIAASDPTQFPVACSCRDAAPPVTPEPDCRLAPRRFATLLLFEEALCVRPQTLAEPRSEIGEPSEPIGRALFEDLEHISRGG